jgi:MFS transporter, DHA1 family, inner membrane transport protein
LGIGLSVVSYFTLFLWDSSLTVALTALAILFLLFEFAMVSSLSLCTELLPGLRATMMSGFLAMAGIGRAFGALMGGAVWQHGGIFAIGCVSGLLTLMGIGCLIYGLRGWRQSPE